MEAPQLGSTAPRIELVAIGDELTAGVYPDRNSGEMAREFLARGFRVEGFHVVGDTEGELAALLAALGGRCDLVVASGGLGPTEDDRTRAEAARATGVGLVEDVRALDEIRAWFRMRSRRFHEANRCQAFFPEGATPIPNRAGTAPGFSLRIGRARCFFLPGPPHEMRLMLRETVLPVVEALPGRRAIASCSLQCYGISESVLGDRIRPHMMPRAGRRCGITVSMAVHTIALSVEGDSQAEAVAELERWRRILAAEVDDVLYGFDGATLQEVLVGALQERALRIATAESCTGGMVAKAITDVPGSSAVFERGVVAYANRAKVEMLGVREATLAASGAVSLETAVEMAAGARAAAGADLAVATTGIAGPDGGTPEKPVGLVCFGVSFGERTLAWRRTMVPHGRELIREVATREALHLALRTLQGRAPQADAEQTFAG